MIYQEDYFKYFWDLFSSILLLITCVLTPFNLAFEEDVADIFWYTTLNYSIDFLFLIDIIIIFNTTLKTEFDEVPDRWEIFKEYTRSWFLIDLLSIMPFDILIA